MKQMHEMFFSVYEVFSLDKVIREGVMYTRHTPYAEIDNYFNARLKVLRTKDVNNSVDGMVYCV